jgi:microcystin-dependent protein
LVIEDTYMSATKLGASAPANDYTLRNNEDGSFDIVRGTTVVMNFAATTGLITGNGIGTPAGTIIDFGGATAPTGYLACNGAAVSRTTYAALFAAIGVLWGVGDNSTTFNLPNFAVGDAAVQGGTVGTDTAGQMPAHTHIVTVSNDTAVAAGAVKQTGTAGGTDTIGTSSTGSGVRTLAAGKSVLKCIKS